MQVIKDNSKHILKLKKGEEFISSIENFCIENNIKGAWFSAIGAAGKITIARYNTDSKEYEKHEFEGMLEIINISGNVSVKNKGELVVHAHGVFGNGDMNAIGGHVVECVVSVTCEIVLDALSAIKREFDDEAGLHLLTSG